MDFSKLKTSDWVIIGSAIVLFFASFLDWFSIDTPFGSAAGNGWDVGFFWAGIPVILGLVMLAQVAVSRFSPETKLPDLPVGWGQAHLIAGGIAAVIVVLKLLIGHEEAGIDFDRDFGLFLAALAAIGLAVGGYLTWQDEKAAGPGPVEGPDTTPPAPF